MKHCRGFTGDAGAQGLDSLLRSARDCFSMVQLGGVGRVDGSEGTWINVGLAYELEYNQGVQMLLQADGDADADADATGKTKPCECIVSPASVGKLLQSAADSYAAALEISKPPAALLLHSQAWLRLHGYTRPSLQCTATVVHSLIPVCSLSSGSGSGSGLGSSGNRGYESTNTAVLHQVQHYIHRFCFHTPHQAAAWCIYAWALEFRGCFQAAQQALVLAMECLARESVDNKERDSDTDTRLTRIQAGQVLQTYCFCGLKRFVSGSGESESESESESIWECVALPSWVTKSDSFGVLKAQISQYTTLVDPGRSPGARNSLVDLSYLLHGALSLHSSVVVDSSSAAMYLFDQYLQDHFSPDCRRWSLYILDLLLMRVSVGKTGIVADPLSELALQVVVGIAQQLSVCPAETGDDGPTETVVPPLAQLALGSPFCLLRCFQAILHLQSAQQCGEYSTLATVSTAFLLKVVDATEHRLALMPVLASASTGPLVVMKLWAIAARLVSIIRGRSHDTDASNSNENGNGFVLPRAATRDLLEVEAWVTELGVRGVDGLGGVNEDTSPSPFCLHGAVIASNAALLLLKSHATATAGISTSDINIAKAVADGGGEGDHDGEEDGEESGRGMAPRKPRSETCPATAAKKALFYNPSSLTAVMLLGLTNKRDTDTDTDTCVSSEFGSGSESKTRSGSRSGKDIGACVTRYYEQTQKQEQTQGSLGVLGQLSYQNISAGETETCGRGSCLNSCLYELLVE